MDKKFFDNAFETAKTAFDVACKKTGDIVSLEKLRFILTNLKSKRSKVYASLGAIYFSKVAKADDLPENEAELVAKIKELNAKIEETVNEINYVKSKRTCPKCGAAIDEDSLFCNYCGEKVAAENGNDYDEI